MLNPCWKISIILHCFKNGNSIFMLQGMKKIDANVYKTSAKKEIYFHDINLYWKTSIKDTIQWFHFIAIIEHTANNLEQNKALVTSLLKVFAMFQLRLFYGKQHE